MKSSRLLFWVLLVFGSSAAYTQGPRHSPTPAEHRCGCFSIVVGKDASADGYVIMAHNEDDTPPLVVNHHKVERQKHDRGEKLRLLGGGEVEQVEQTWAYIWSEMPGFLFSDSYINEWGVCIASDQCRSREDRPDLSDGGISYMLRRLVAERATTARQGVLLAGELVERFGYDSSGRTYIICDPVEGWLFCVVHGKHWLAERVPDEEVAMIANTYTVCEVDLSDQRFFLGCPDIVEYAVSRGWYDPEKEEQFDFAAVYADPQAASDPTNLGRLWSGFRYLTDSLEYGDKLPFSVKPNRKLDVPGVIEILRDHYQGTDLYEASPSGCPHERSFEPICRHSTQSSFVVQLRKDRPLDIGIVYWVCLGSPCLSFYHPFHFGLAEFPEGWSTDLDIPSRVFYQASVESVFHPDMLCAFWTYSNFRHKVEERYGELIDRVREKMGGVERCAFELQEPVEQAALQLYPTDREKAMQLLTNYSNGLYLSALEAMGRVLSER